MGENSFKTIFYENQYLLSSVFYETQYLSNRMTYFPRLAFNLS